MHSGITQQKHSISLLLTLITCWILTNDNWGCDVTWVNINNSSTFVLKQLFSFSRETRVVSVCFAAKRCNTDAKQSALKQEKTSRVTSQAHLQTTVLSQLQTVGKWRQVGRLRRGLDVEGTLSFGAWTAGIQVSLKYCFIPRNYFCLFNERKKLLFHWKHISVNISSAFYSSEIPSDQLVSL